MAMPMPNSMRMTVHANSPAPKNEKSILDCIVNAVKEKKMVAVIIAAIITAFAPSSARCVPTAQWKAPP